MVDEAKGACCGLFRRLLFSTLFIICASPTLAQFNDGSGDPFDDGLLAAPALVGVVHRELSFGTMRMVMIQTGWRPSTILFDQLELPEEAGSMLRELGRLLNKR